MTLASYLHTPAVVTLAGSMLCGSMLSSSERRAPAHLRSAHTAPVGCKSKSQDGGGYAHAHCPPHNPIDWAAMALCLFTIQRGSLRFGVGVAEADSPRGGRTIRALKKKKKKRNPTLTAAVMEL